jgi:hypothetical protein
MAASTHGAVFHAFKNSVFGTPEDMAVAAPMATAGIPRHLFLFDTFLQRVVPHRGLWPVGASATGTPLSSYDVHKRNVDLLRADLTRAPNSDPVAPDEPANIPRWRIDLLDRAVQKAFYSDPPIPIETDRQDATGTLFEIAIRWDVDVASGRPTKLYLTIFCPVTAPDGTTPAP